MSLISIISDIPLITTSITTIVAVSAFLVNIRYQHNSKVAEAKIRQREAIRTYSVRLIGAMRDFSDVQIRYFKERLRIDEEAERTATLKASPQNNYFFQLKDSLHHKRAILGAMVQNSKIEISNIDFPNTQARISKSYQYLDSLTGGANFDEVRFKNLQEIEVLEMNFNGEINRLVDYLAGQQDNLTEDILKRTLRRH